eukprot:SAG31_NODE_3746_length_3928_cov_4.375555_2_plen_440_part_00
MLALSGATSARLWADLPSPLFPPTPLIEEALLCRARVNAAGWGGRTPLHEACQYGHEECCAALLSAGGDPQVQDAKGKTAVDWATPHKSIVDILSQTNGLRRSETSAADGDGHDGASAQQPTIDRPGTAWLREHSLQREVNAVGRNGGVGQEDAVGEDDGARSFGSRGVVDRSDSFVSARNRSSGLYASGLTSLSGPRTTSSTGRIAPPPPPTPTPTPTSAAPVDEKSVSGEDKRLGAVQMWAQKTGMVLRPTAADAAAPAASAAPAPATVPELARTPTSAKAPSRSPRVSGVASEDLLSPRARVQPGEASVASLHMEILELHELIKDLRASEQELYAQVVAERERMEEYKFVAAQCLTEAERSASIDAELQKEKAAHAEALEQLTAERQERGNLEERLRAMQTERKDCYFSFLCPLLEKYGTFIARCNALIEKVSSFR